MKKTYILLLVILAAGLGSCTKDFLEKEPLTDRVEANFYKTPNDAFQALVSVYDVLQWQPVVAIIHLIW